MADVDTAVRVARAAQPSWAGVTPADRSAMLGRLVRLAALNADELIAQEVSQNGKPVRLATDFDLPGSVDNIIFLAGAARHQEGKATAEYSSDHTSSIRREAVGVVARIASWNYPLQMAVWKVLPALAAGCAVVIKPPEIVPLTTLTHQLQRSWHRGAGSAEEQLTVIVVASPVPRDRRRGPIRAHHRLDHTTPA